MNSNKLIGIMAERGYSQRGLAKELGISKTTLNIKLNGKGLFNTEEVSKICDVLQIFDDKLKVEIFLS